MKLLRVSIVLAIAVWTTADAYGQLGLYGSPEPLPLQSAQAAPASGQPAAGAYGTSAPLVYQASAEDQSGPRIPPPPGAWTPGQPMPTPQAAPQSGPASGMSVVNEVLGNDQAAPTGCAASNGAAGCDVPGLGGCQTGCCNSGWYGSALALYMTRDKPNMLYTSALDSNWAEQWGDNHFDWRWGGEVRIGRRFCCDQWSIEGAYWTLDHFSGVATPPADPMGYDTPFQMNVPNQFNPNVPELIVKNTWDSAGNPTTPQEWFDASPQHQISRCDELHSIEINFLRNHVMGDGCQPLNIDCVLGARYFRFRDRLTFSAQHQANDWLGQPSDFAGDWISLDDEVTNNLIGVQFGLNADYRVAERWKLFLNPRFGLYNNRMNLDYNLYGKDASGNTLQASSATYPSTDYPIHSSTDGFSFMTQLDAGVDWQVTDHWGAMIGYRVLAITGMGLADNQVPSYGNDTAAIARMNTNGSLILHGAFAGLTFTF